MKDKFTRKAKQEGFKARSVYKLREINNKYRLITKEDCVLDLGCWPGSWLQVCSKITKNVIGIDKRKTNVPGIKTYFMDVFDDRIFDFGMFDVVLSDLAPTTTGNINIDQYKSYELSTRAFDIASKVLKKNGNFLVKIFQGEDSVKLLEKMRRKFNFVKSIKPTSSKKKSKEIYYVGLGFK